MPKGVMSALQVVAALLAWPLLTAGTPCGEARLRCAYRTGCGAALNNYMIYCSDVMAGPVHSCPEQCQHAIIALTSTEEGKELMNCECEDDDYCLQSKSRIDICRSAVLKTAQNTTMSCRLSQLICAVDSECATALDYYHRLCRSMFHGRKCSHKCMNSINILRKQKKAEMLERCRCDGLEDFDCLRIQTNMARLCFHKRTGEVHGGGVGGGGEHQNAHAHDRERERERNPADPAPANPSAAAATHLSLPTLTTLILSAYHLTKA